MKTFTKTTKGGDRSHYHIVYLNDEGGVPMVFPEQGHVHDVTLDPVTGAWRVGPAVDGHMHEVDEYVADVVVKRETDEEVLSGVYELLSFVREHERSNLERAEESERFYCGIG